MSQTTHHPTKPQVLSLIAAVARDGGIGHSNRLLFALPEDMQHFRIQTMGCPVIMGRKTWDSLPPRFRPLPGRRNLVLSRNAHLQCAGAEVVNSLPQALALLAGQARAFVIGGADLYAQALPLADELVLTEVDATAPADAWFPAWDRSAYAEVSRRSHATEGPERIGYAFVVYRRLSHD